MPAVADLVAKAAGMRTCELFGGAHRQWVPTDWWMGRSDPQHAARQMEVGLKLGFNSIKMKGALEDDIVGIVRALKNVAGDTTIRLPEGPGLGVKLDQVALKKYAQRREEIMVA